MYNVSQLVSQLVYINVRQTGQAAFVASSFSSWFKDKLFRQFFKIMEFSNFKDLDFYRLTTPSHQIGR